MKTNIRRIKQSYWIGKAIWGEKKWVLDRADSQGNREKFS